MRITTEQTSIILGVSVQTIQYGLQVGKYPFGTYLKRNGASRGMYDIQSSKLASYLNVSEEDILRRVENESKERISKSA